MVNMIATEAGRINASLERLGSAGHPTVAVLEVTHRCNARCEYCFIDHAGVHPELSTEELLFVIDKLAGSGILSLLITGGEPFMRADILRIIEHAISKDFFSVSLFTNGLLLTEEHLDFIIRHKKYIAKIKMSAFSHIPRINDSYFKVRGAMNTILKNGEKLIEHGLNVGLSIAAMDFNVADLMETKLFYSKKKFDVTSSPFKIPGAKGDFAAVDSRSKEFMKQYFAHYPEETKERFRRVMNERLEAPGDHLELCKGRITSLVVNPEGDISPCTSFRALRFGSIFDTRPLRDILLSSEQYNRLRAMKKTDFEPCRTCKFIGFCNICPGIIYTATGELKRADPQVCNHAETLYEILYGS
ncbi:MAG: radical SAM protein [Chitinivibrionales bacterium]|nr:radical SAM protein [Chitinivibrionales bacterium]